MVERRAVKLATVAGRREELSDATPGWGAWDGDMGAPPGPARAPSGGSATATRGRGG